MPLAFRHSRRDALEARWPLPASVEDVRAQARAHRSGWRRLRAVDVLAASHPFEQVLDELAVAERTRAAGADQLDGVLGAHPVADQRSGHKQT
jgi:hypothetical protein